MRRCFYSSHLSFEVLVDETGAMYNAKTKVKGMPNFRPSSDHYQNLLQIWQDQLDCQHLLNLLSHFNYIGLWRQDSVDCGNEL